MTEAEIKTIRKNQYTHLIIGLLLLLLAILAFSFGYVSHKAQLLGISVVVLGSIFSVRATLKILAFNKFLRDSKSNDDLLDA